MGAYNIRFGSQLTFDEQQEADIIKLLEALNSSHKMGKFLSNLIRIACDCPDVLEFTLGQYKHGPVMRQVEESGMCYNRKVFMDKLEREVNNMRTKVDKIYDMSLKNYMLAQAGKHIGLEEKSKNQLLAEFILEKQVKELQDILGVALMGSALASNKMQKKEELAADTLEYMIEVYGSLLDELKSIKEQQVVVQAIPATMISESSASTINTVDNTKEEQNKQNEVDNSDTKTEENQIEEEDEIIDFGGADMGALLNFFGD